MIESPAIKRFIVLHFLENPTETVFDMVRSIHSYLKANFVADEEVFVKSRRTHAKVQGITGDRYILKTLSEFDLCTVEICPEDMVRMDHLSKSCILRFLDNITKDSPFGRVLRKNIVYDMSIFSNEKANSSKVDKREQSRDMLFSRCKEAKCTEDDYTHGEMDKSYEMHTDSNFRSVEASGSGDSDVKLTLQSEDGMVVGNASYDKGKTTLQKGERVFSKENDKETGTNHIKVGDPYLKGKLSSISSVIELLNCTSVEINGICDLELFVEVCLLFNHFRKYFNIELSKEDFAEALLDRSYGTEVAFRIHKVLLDVLSAELNTAGRSQFKQILENAIDICVPENIVFGCEPPLEKYDWSNTDIAEHNWKDVMGNFCSQIYYTYGLHGIVFYREFTTGCADDVTSDRLGIIKFLIECMFCTNTFRQVVNASVEEARKSDKNIVAKLRRTRSSTSDTESLDRAANVDVSSLERSLDSVESKILSSGYRADIANIDGVLFVYFEGHICFWRDRRLYMMSTEQVKYLQRAYMPQSRHHIPFSVHPKNCFFFFPRNASNASEIYLSDRESQ